MSGIGAFPIEAVRPPKGLHVAMEGLAREVLRQNPTDIYKFAAEYFEKLIQLREQFSFKGRCSEIQELVKENLLSSSENVTETPKKLLYYYNKPFDEEKKQIIYDPHKKVEKDRSDSSLEVDKVRCQSATLLEPIKRGEGINNIKSNKKLISPVAEVTETPELENELVDINNDVNELEEDKIHQNVSSHDENIQSPGFRNSIIFIDNNKIVDESTDNRDNVDYVNTDETEVNEAISSNKNEEEADIKETTQKLTNNNNVDEDNESTHDADVKDTKDDIKNEELIEVVEDQIIEKEIEENEMDEKNNEASALESNDGHRANDLIELNEQKNISEENGKLEEIERKEVGKIESDKNGTNDLVIEKYGDDVDDNNVEFPGTKTDSDKVNEINETSSEHELNDEHIKNNSSNENELECVIENEDDEHHSKSELFEDKSAGGSEVKTNERGTSDKAENESNKEDNVVINHEFIVNEEIENSSEIETFDIHEELHEEKSENFYEDKAVTDGHVKTNEGEITDSYKVDINEEASQENLDENKAVTNSDIKTNEDEITDSHEVDMNEEVSEDKSENVDENKFVTGGDVKTDEDEITDVREEKSKNVDENKAVTDSDIKTNEDEITDSHEVDINEEVSEEKSENVDENKSVTDGDGITDFKMKENEITDSHEVDINEEVSEEKSENVDENKSVTDCDGITDFKMKENEITDSHKIDINEEASEEKSPNVDKNKDVTDSDVKIDEDEITDSLEENEHNKIENGLHTHESEIKENIENNSNLEALVGISDGKSENSDDKKNVIYGEAIIIKNKELTDIDQTNVEDKNNLPRERKEIKDSYLTDYENESNETISKDKDERSNEGSEKNNDPISQNISVVDTLSQNEDKIMSDVQEHLENNQIRIGARSGLSDENDQNDSLINVERNNDVLLDHNVATDLQTEVVENVIVKTNVNSQQFNRANNNDHNQSDEEWKKQVDGEIKNSQTGENSDTPKTVSPDKGNDENESDLVIKKKMSQNEEVKNDEEVENNAKEKVGESDLDGTVGVAENIESVDQGKELNHKFNELLNSDYGDGSEIGAPLLGVLDDKSETTDLEGNQEKNKEVKTNDYSEAETAVRQSIDKETLDPISADNYDEKNIEPEPPIETHEDKKDVLNNLTKELIGFMDQEINKLKKSEGIIDADSVANKNGETTICEDQDKTIQDQLIDDENTVPNEDINDTDVDVDDVNEQIVTNVDLSPVDNSKISTLCLKTGRIHHNNLIQNSEGNKISIDECDIEKTHAYHTHIDTPEDASIVDDPYLDKDEIDNDEESFKKSISGLESINNKTEQINEGITNPGLLDVSSQEIQDCGQKYIAVPVTQGVNLVLPIESDEIKTEDEDSNSQLDSLEECANKHEKLADVNSPVHSNIENEESTVENEKNKDDVLLGNCEDKYKDMDLSNVEQIVEDFIALEKFHTELVNNAILTSESHEPVNINEASNEEQNSKMESPELDTHDYTPPTSEYGEEFNIDKDSIIIQDIVSLNNFENNKIILILHAEINENITKNRKTKRSISLQDHERVVNTHMSGASVDDLIMNKLTNEYNKYHESVNVESSEMVESNNLEDSVAIERVEMIQEETIETITAELNTATTESFEGTIVPIVEEKIIETVIIDNDNIEIQSRNEGVEEPTFLNQKGFAENRNSISAEDNTNNEQDIFEKASIIIQKVFRGFCVRKNMKSNAEYSERKGSRSDSVEDAIFEKIEEPILEVYNKSDPESVDIDLKRRLNILLRSTSYHSPIDSKLYTVSEEKNLSSTDEESSTFSSAATKIQAGVRGFLTRRYFQRNKTGNSSDTTAPSIGEDSRSIEEYVTPADIKSSTDDSINKIVVTTSTILIEQLGHFDKIETSNSHAIPDINLTEANKENEEVLTRVTQNRKKLRREDAIQVHSPFSSGETPTNRQPSKISEDDEQIGELAQSIISEIEKSNYTPVVHIKQSANSPSPVHKGSNLDGSNGDSKSNSEKDITPEIDETRDGFKSFDNDDYMGSEILKDHTDKNNSNLLTQYDDSSNSDSNELPAINNLYYDKRIPRKLPRYVSADIETLVSKHRVDDIDETVVKINEDDHDSSEEPIVKSESIGNIDTELIAKDGNVGGILHSGEFHDTIVLPTKIIRKDDVQKDCLGDSKLMVQLAQLKLVLQNTDMLSDAADVPNHIIKVQNTSLTTVPEHTRQTQSEEVPSESNESNFIVDEKNGQIFIRIYMQRLWQKYRYKTKLIAHIFKKHSKNSARQKKTISLSRKTKKELRAAGKRYTSVFRKVVHGRKRFTFFRRKCTYKCSDRFSEQEKDEIFTEYWKLGEKFGSQYLQRQCISNFEG